jgi:hypothetical protein
MLMGVVSALKELRGLQAWGEQGGIDRGLSRGVMGQPGIQHLLNEVGDMRVKNRPGGWMRVNTCETSYEQHLGTPVGHLTKVMLVPRGPESKKNWGKRIGLVVGMFARAHVGWMKRDEGGWEMVSVWKIAHCSNFRVGVVSGKRTCVAVKKLTILEMSGSAG